MYAYSTDGGGQYKNIKLARDPWLGLTAIVQGKPYLTIGKNGSKFVMEGEDHSILELEKFDWTPATDESRLIAASRMEGSPLHYANVIEGYLVGKLAYFEDNWYVRNGTGETIVPVAAIADLLDKTGGNVPRVADWQNEIKWVYMNDGEVLFEDLNQPVPNHLALVMQQKGDPYVESVMESGDTRPIGIMGTIQDSKIRVAGPLTTDPSQDHKAFKPDQSIAGAIRVQKAVSAVADQAVSRGIEVDPSFSFNRVTPGEGMSQQERLVAAHLQKSAATFQYNLPPMGIHGRTHEAMHNAGLQATVDWPEDAGNYQSVIPGPTGFKDMMNVTKLQMKGVNIEDIVVTVTTNDNPEDVVAVIDALGGRQPDMTNINPEVAAVIDQWGVGNRQGGLEEDAVPDKKKALTCPKCDSHTLRAMDSDEGDTVDMTCLTCGNEFKTEVLRNPESSTQKEGIGGSQYSYPKARSWERDRMRLRDDEWDAKPQGWDHPTEGWYPRPPDPLEQEQFVQDKLHPDTGDVNVLGPIECPTCGESLQGADTSGGVCPYCSAPTDLEPGVHQPFAHTAADLDPNVQQQILGLTQQIQMATQNNDTVLVQQLQQQLQQLLGNQGHMTPGTPMTPGIVAPFSSIATRVTVTDLGVVGFRETMAAQQQGIVIPVTFPDGTTVQLGQDNPFDLMKAIHASKGMEPVVEMDADPETIQSVLRPDTIVSMASTEKESWIPQMPPQNPYRAPGGGRKYRPWEDKKREPMEPPTVMCAHCGGVLDQNEGNGWGPIACPHCGHLLVNDSAVAPENMDSFQDEHMGKTAAEKYPVGTRVEVNHQKYKGQRGSITEFNGTHEDLGDERYTILLDSGDTIKEVDESVFKKIKSAKVDNSNLEDSTQNYFLESLTFEAAGDPFGGSTPKKPAPHDWDGGDYKNNTPDDYHAPEPDYRWDEPDDTDVECHLCGGSAKSLGELGARAYYHCSDCGQEFSVAKEDSEISNGDPEDLFGWDATHIGSLEEGKYYTLHGPNYKVPDVIKVLKVDGDKVEAAVESDHDAQFPFTIEGEGYRFDPYEQPESVDKIEERIESNSNWKVARRNFSPAEQRGLVEEGKGASARNIDKLNLEGTHYQISTEAKDDLDNFFLWN